MLEIINCIQGSPEWVQARLGIPTASEFAAIPVLSRSLAPVTPMAMKNMSLVCPSLCFFAIG